MGASAHLGCRRLSPPSLLRRQMTMSSRDQINLPAVRPDHGAASPDRQSDQRPSDATGSGRTVPMLWRVFAANAAVFALAFALLAVAPLEIHIPVRVDELVLLLVGLAVMLVVDLALLRQALTPLARLARLMGRVDLLRPGQRAAGFERSSSEVVALAQAFNEMLDRLETERRDSSARVLAAQEDERLRIARELHDEIGQTLTAVALRAEHSSAHTERGGAELSVLAEMIQQSLEEVRRISRELRPEALDELGLRGALIALCSRVAEQGRLDVHRDLQGPLPELQSEVELAIYRIAQEALTNAVRHSQAKNVTLSLLNENGQLTLTVRDDGGGLPNDAVEGTGMTGMRERAMLIGAELEVESTPGAGVTVRLQLPA
jgi:two-component system, NarL family, sensor histidine kinase UhpB